MQVCKRRKRTTKRSLQTELDSARGASEAVGRTAPGEEQIVNAAERIPYCPEAESDRKRSSDDLLVIAVVYCIDHVGRRWHAV
jgi:hypothetical protein